MIKSYKNSIYTYLIQNSWINKKWRRYIETSQLWNTASYSYNVDHLKNRKKCNRVRNMKPVESRLNSSMEIFLDFLLLKADFRIRFRLLRNMIIALLFSSFPSSELLNFLDIRKEFFST